MRIIAGKAGRLAIQVPPTVTRPTTDMVRQAVFSIIGESIDGACVLDLFAGSGALGLEALSRGAESSVFVEENRQAAGVIRRNLENSRLPGGRVVQADVDRFLKRDTGRYHWVFADPPYWKNASDRDHVGKLLGSERLVPRMMPGGHLVIEVSTRQASPIGAGFELLARREYGSSAILIYRSLAEV